MDEYFLVYLCVSKKFSFVNDVVSHYSMFCVMIVVENVRFSSLVLHMLAVRQGWRYHKCCDNEVSLSCAFSQDISDKQ